MAAPLRLGAPSACRASCALHRNAPARLPPRPAPCAQIYHYNLDTGAAFDPLTFRTRTHVAARLDVAAMRAGAAALVGTHDFTQFR